MKRRVVITGVGLITPLGNNTQETWQGLLDGRSGVGPITRFDASLFPTRIAAEVKNFDYAEFVEKKEIKKICQENLLLKWGHHGKTTFMAGIYGASFS